MPSQTLLAQSQTQTPAWVQKLQSRRLPDKQAAALAGAMMADEKGVRVALLGYGLVRSEAMLRATVRAAALLLGGVLGPRGDVYVHGYCHAPTCDAASASAIIRDGLGGRPASEMGGDGDGDGVIDDVRSGCGASVCPAVRMVSLTTEFDKAVLLRASAGCDRSVLASNQRNYLAATRSLRAAYEAAASATGQGGASGGGATGGAGGGGGVGRGGHGGGRGGGGHAGVDGGGSAGYAAYVLWRIDTLLLPPPLWDVILHRPWHARDTIFVPALQSGGYVNDRFLYAGTHASRGGTHT